MITVIWKPEVTSEKSFCVCVTLKITVAQWDKFEICAFYNNTMNTQEHQNQGAKFWHTCSARPGFQGSSDEKGEWKDGQL